MRPFFRYFGTKWRLAQKQPKARGTVREPFAGSAGYSVYPQVARHLR
jgi:site-specific DNA-adenine methylase